VPSIGRRASEDGDDGAAYRRQGRLRRADSDSFSPARLGDPAALQVGIGDHRHQGAAMKTLPGAAFEVIKARAVGHGHLARPFAAVV
jgi:hypothetical protein